MATQEQDVISKQDVSCSRQDACVFQNDSGKAEEADAELLAWAAWWSEMHAAGLVATGVDATAPSNAISAAWRKSQNNAEAKAALTDRDAIRTAIQSASFIQSAGWFRLEKLLGGRNQDGELIVRKLLDGGYSRGNTNAQNGRQYRDNTGSPVGTPGRGHW